MARWVQISTSEGMSSPRLDSQGCATLQFKAKNVSGAPLDTRAVLRNVPATSPPSGPVQNGWVKIEGSAEQHFEKDQEKVFVVKIAVPKKDKPKPGNYQFRLDVVSIAVPDNGDSSDVMAFTVDQDKQGPKPFPMWLIPVIVVVLIGIGVGIYFAVRQRGITVPDLTGQTVDQAKTNLAAKQLALAEPVKTTPDAQHVNQIVDQSPAAGESATKGQAVQVTVGTQSSSPPRLETTNQTYQSRQPSGTCANFSQWYLLCSDNKPSDWKIVSEHFQLTGDRSCNKWANCNETLKTAAKVCYQFQLQGHSEKCPPRERGNGVEYSTGELTVAWQHPSQ